MAWSWTSILRRRRRSFHRVGTDAKYWSGSSISVQDDFDSSYSSLNAMLEQLPSETAVKIREGTAKTLFGLTQ